MKIITIVVSIFIVKNIKCNLINTDLLKCNVDRRIKDEIANYKYIADTIIDKIVNGDFKGTTYSLLENFIDKFGSRVTGSESLENSINYMLNKSIQEGLENVHGESVEAPYWIRGNEYATLLQPRKQKISMLGLGLSIGTPPEGVIAEAVVFNSFDEMKQNSEKVSGKIVVFNQEYTDYQNSNIFRLKGPVEASRFGAKAVLIRSITPFSMNTPHTGTLKYDNNVTKIPAACITIEDAQMLKRMYDKNETITVHLKMDAKNLQDVNTRNVVAEFQGEVMPEKVVIISGHIDSWDIGQGAMDDGGGMMMSWNALNILKKLGLRPKRTIRTVLWTAEEQGLIGAYKYYKDHKHEIKNFNFLMESDNGTFEPIGFGFSGNKAATCIFNEILKLLKSINATKITGPLRGGPDIRIWTNRDNIPGATLSTKNERYFWYHHTEADRIDIYNPRDLDLCTAAWAVVSFVIADLSIDMPR